MISVLEDAPITNAGFGSNLNLDGKVECDASIMNGTTLGFGSVGAVTDFKNPIQVAARVLQDSDKGPLSLGRIPPIMLVGPGVTRWVDTMGYQLDRVNAHPTLDDIRLASDLNDDNGSHIHNDHKPTSLVSKTALDQYLHYSDLLKQHASKASSFTATKRKGDFGEESPAKRQIDHVPAPKPTFEKTQDEKEIDEERNLMNDTVGAICVDRLGRIAAGVSSGGISLKFPGRVSEAGLYGAGCWAQDPSTDVAGFACSVTGAGEQITKTLLAKTCMDQMLSDDDTHQAARRVLENFIASPLLRSYGDRHAGFICLKVDPREEHQDCARGNEPCAAPSEDVLRGEFIYGHTTPTMVKKTLGLLL
ncbi:taspase, threonine aspartase, 1 [Podila epigama]|nr:taspase, threonine aspartase, 1 [Podila epigama]